MTLANCLKDKQCNSVLTGPFLNCALDMKYVVINTYNNTFFKGTERRYFISNQTI